MVVFGPPPPPPHPDRSVFNGGGGGGGSGMDCFLAGPFSSTWQESIGSDSHRLPWSDIPCHPMTSFSTFSPKDHISLLCQSPLSPVTSPFTIVTPQSTPATSSSHIRHSLLPAISRSKRPVGNLLLANLSVSLLTCPPCPNGYPFAQNYHFPSFFHCLLCRLTREYLSRRTRAQFPHFLSVSSQPSKATVIPTNDCLTCRYFHSDGAKIKEDRS
jgi:hypothetical protein